MAHPSWGNSWKNSWKSSWGYKITVIVKRTIRAVKRIPSMYLDFPRFRR
jgi:hypothetical protein